MDDSEDSNNEGRVLGKADETEPYILNHKGTYCIYKSILCQEGFCNDCEIFRVWCIKLWN